MFRTHGWFKNLISKKMAIIIVAPLLLSSCGNPLKLQAGSGRSESSLSDYYGTNKSLTYANNPIVLSGNAGTASGSFADLPLKAEFITSNQTLAEKCLFTQNTTALSEASVQTTNDCIRVLLNNDPNTEALTSEQSSWNYPVDSDNFIQVNTFYHIKKLVKAFHKTLNFSHKFVHFSSSMLLPPATPAYLKDSKTFWLTEQGITQTLTVYAKCNMEPMNSYFDPANNELCFGWNEEYSRYKFFMAQDPSVIYHELGHALIKTMMNERNIELDTGLVKTYDSYLGSLFYDEAGAINEGLADYFAYYMLGRSRIGEWAMGRFFDAARPLRESDGLHTVNVAETYDKRLSYPNFLQYDPNDTTKNYEDIHYAGQIISHYFVALTENLKTSCTFPTTGTYTRISLKHELSTDYVMTVLNESLAEIGDLFSRGSDLVPNGKNFNNMNENHSYLWTQLVNPPNMKRFMQIVAKNINNYISGGLCPEFTIDKSEQLLDSYGLLLFKRYRDQGVSSDGTQKYADLGSTYVFSGRYLSSSSTGTSVNELNRQKSVLIAKDFISLPTDRSIAYVFDSQSAIKSILANLTFQGANVQTTEGIADVAYNNNNILISPGEVVGVSLNLINNSNSTMAGVQVLANDFDHMKMTNSISSYVNRDVNRLDPSRSSYISRYEPCSINSFPTSTEGGAGTTESSVLPDQCNNITKTNDQIFLLDTVTSGSETTVYPQYAPDSPQPVCFVQQLENDETKWVSQDTLRMEQGVEDHECLNNPTMSNDKFNPNECLIRFLPGANQAILGKIDPQKTWAETLQGTSGTAPVFNQSTILLMEVNKNVRPGTTFNCRLRVRFSNCSDCYNDSTTSKEYPDYEYAGQKPFKLINFKFTVTQ